MKRSTRVILGSALVLVVGTLYLGTGSTTRPVEADKGTLAIKAACLKLGGTPLLGGRFCTHGDDEAAFAGQGDAPRTCAVKLYFVCIGPVEIHPSPTLSVSPSPSPEPTPSPVVGCGSDVNRIQAIYLRESSQPDRLSDRSGIFINAANDADGVLMRSAQREGHEAHLRFVTDDQCHLSIKQVVTDQQLNSFSDEINAVSNAGYSQSDYLYLIFSDKDLGCGIGTIYGDSQPDPIQNTNNNHVGYSSIYPGCTNGPTVMHELSHNMGAVQNDAPDSTGAWHSTDTPDLMSYADGGPTDTQHQECSGEALMDCGLNDYFAFNPKGSYLDSHWNLTKSRWIDTK